MNKRDGLEAARDLVRRRGGHEPPQLAEHTAEVRTPATWKATVGAGVPQFRPEAFNIIVWRYAVPLAQVANLHNWLATNEITLATLCETATGNLVHYLGTYLDVDTGGPRYETFWGYTADADGGGTEAAEAALTAALSPNSNVPQLRDLLKILRSYWVRDAAAVDHRLGQARHYTDLNAASDTFWEVTRLAINEPPL